MKINKVDYSILQKQICSKYNSLFTLPKEQEKMGVALGTLKLEPIYGSRIKPAGDTCGWFIWGGDHREEADFYQTVHVGHVSDIAPMIEKYLALAPGHKFIIDSTGYEDVWFDESLLLM